MTTMTCRGRNHADTASRVQCPRCGRSVVRTGNGLANLHINHGGGESYWCWDRHECSETAIAAHEGEQARALLAGVVATGSAVEVVKGRKIPVGTVGVVKWIGESAYGERIGLAVDGTKGLVYVAIGNVATRATDEERAAAQAIVDALDADVAAVQAADAALTEWMDRAEELAPTWKAAIATLPVEERPAAHAQAMEEQEALYAERRAIQATRDAITTRRGWTI